MNLFKISKKIIDSIIQQDDYIPLESGLQENTPSKNISFSNLYYFGNCINTVDKDKMWDATEMSHVISQSVIVPTENVLKSIKNGQRNIPSKLIQYIHSNKNDLNKKSNIICGYNEYQEIVFIYIANQDIHYFFDA